MDSCDCVCGGGEKLHASPHPPAIVECYATLHPALSVHPSVSPCVGPSVGPSVTLYFFVFFLLSLASLLLSKWSSDLKYSPCPPTCDWGSRVSDLVFLSKELVVIWHQTCTMGCTCLRTRYNREYLKILKRLKMYNFKYISIILISFVYMKKNKYHDFIRF